MKHMQAIGCVVVAAVLLACGPTATDLQPVPAADSLLSWNQRATKQQILDFVSRVTDPQSPDFVPEPERIATFDNDGTLWAEKPLYVQLFFALDRVKELAPQHPEWKNTEPYASLLKGDVNAALAGGEKAILEVVMATHAGMTTAEFEKIVKDWIATARHPETKRLYTEMVYQPMLELLAFLRANGFKTFIVSGGGIEFMRPWAEKTYGIPPEQVVGSSIKTKFEMRDDGPVLVRLAAINFIDDKDGSLRQLRRRPADARVGHRRTGCAIRASRPPHRRRARVRLRQGRHQRSRRSQGQRLDCGRHEERLETNLPGCGGIALRIRDCERVEGGHAHAVRRDRRLVRSVRSTLEAGARVRGTVCGAASSPEAIVRSGEAARGNEGREMSTATKSKPRPMIAGFLILVLVAAVLPAAAEDDSDAAKAAAQANNPLANMVAFNIQNYYYSELYGTDDTANTAWLRYAQPFGKWLMRASLPISTVPTGAGADPVSGLGDFNVFLAYLLSDPSSPKQFGVGPLLAAPTATEDALGSDTWQVGAAGVYFNASSPVYQWGGLVTYQTDVAGDGDDVSLAVLQPFFFVQLGKGTYLRMAPLWIFNLEDDSYSVPLGFGIGKVVKAGHTVFNIFIEPQFTVLHDGVGQPEMQIFAGLNMQFLPK